MDPGETLFKGLLRIWKKVRGDGDPPKPGAAFLSDHAERLELLGALLLGAVPDIKPAEGAGGLTGTALLLPRRIELFEEAEDNELVYLYRVAYAASAREAEMDLAAARDDRVGALTSLMAVPAVLTRLHERYPGTRALTERFAARELATRPEPGLRTVFGVVEALAQAQLRAAAGVTEGEREDPPTGGDPRVAGWLKAARAVGAAAAELVGSDAADRDVVGPDVVGLAVADPAVADPAVADPAVADPDVAARTAAPELLHDEAAARWAELCRFADQAGGALPEVCIWGRLWPRPVELEEEEAGEGRTAPADPGKRRVVELERTIRLDRQKLGEREDKPIFHVFEKLETAEDYRGQSATPDASGDVEQMKDALNELSLGTAIRTADDPRNLVRAELLVDPGGLEIAERVRAIDERVFSYPEWNHKKNAYREGWATVVEERFVAEDAGRANTAAAGDVLRDNRRHVEDIRGHLIRTLHQRQVRDRQTDGPEIDVNAMVERHADLVAGRTPTDRLYLGSRRSLREIAILVLLDTSYSTDAWLQGRRVLDVEIESLLILSAALEGLIEEEVAVASFRSHTRHDVRFGVLKGFDDSWAHLRRVAPGLQAEGYTRIGAALRHGAAILDEAHARKKLLLLVSDGKPTDYDRYEGRYGVEDVSRAVREASERRIRCFGLAIEKEAKLHLARMLGPGSYRILPRTSMLPEVMAEVFLGMLTG